MMLFAGSFSRFTDQSKLIENVRRLAGSANRNLEHDWHVGAHSAWLRRPASMPLSVATDPCGTRIVLGRTASVAGPPGASPLHAAAAQLTYGAVLDLLAGGGFRVMADPLGLFRLFYCSNREEVCVAHSPALLRAWEPFDAGLDLAGLAGILLTMHSLSGRTLLRGARLLPAGHSLLFEPASGAREEPAPLDPPEPPITTLEEALDALLASLAANLRRWSADGGHTMLLSGGLDSRLLAAILNQAGHPVDTVTFGDASDIEVRVARQLASHLRWNHRVVPVEAERYLHWAEAEIDEEWLSSGFSTVWSWSMTEAFDAQHGPVLTGLLGDAVAGGSHIPWGLDPLLHRYAFDALFPVVNRWGVPLPLLRRLVRDDRLASAVDQVAQELASTFHHLPGQPWQKVWRFDLMHRQRLYVGSLARQLSVHSWPHLPFADPQLVRLASRFTLPVIDRRRVETALLCRRFPQLARLPLDRNDYNTTPLLADTWRWHPAMRLLRRLAPRKNPLSLFYYRVGDFNNRGWTEIRRRAASHFDRLADLFHKEVLLDYLPDPSLPLTLPDAIIDTSGRNLLCGLLLWSAKYL